MSGFFLQLRGELLKLFARKRTYIGFGAFLIVESLIVILLRLPFMRRAIERTIERMGYDPAGYFSGLTIAHIVILATMLLLGALYLSLVAGDLVSKEVEDGTMRMILCRPVSRSSVLLQKAAACFVYAGALGLFISTSALLLGLLQGGIGGLIVVAPFEKVFALYEFWPGLQRYLLAQPFLIASLCSVSAMGLFFSCLNAKPAAATILTLSILFIDWVLRMIPYFESIRSWFLTSHLASWIYIFEPRIPWNTVLENYVVLLALDATFLLLGWCAFVRRDFKS